MPRDWDVLDAIVARLEATGAFDVVAVSDPPELAGRKAGYGAVAVVSPGSADETEGGSDDPDATQWTRTVRYALAVQARDKDPHARDRSAERLLNVARGAIDDDTSIAGVTLPGKSRIFKDGPTVSTPPAVTLNAVGTFCYFIDGPSGHSIDP